MRRALGRRGKDRNANDQLTEIGESFLASSLYANGCMLVYVNEARFGGDAMCVPGLGKSWRPKRPPCSFIHGPCTCHHNGNVCFLLIRTAYGTPVLVVRRFVRRRDIRVDETFLLVIMSDPILDKTACRNLCSSKCFLTGLLATVR